MAVQLPPWIAQRSKGVFAIDPDIAYPAVLRLLDVKQKDYDQYWIEAAYQCVKLAAQDLIYGTELDPRPAKALVLIIESGEGRKERWALSRFRRGRGTVAATGTRSLHLPSEAKTKYLEIGLDLREGRTEPPGQAQASAAAAKPARG